MRLACASPWARLPARCCGWCCGESLVLLGIGVGLGVPATLAASHAIQAGLFGLSPSDPFTLISRRECHRGCDSDCCLLPGAAGHTDRSDCGASVRVSGLNE